MLETVAEPVIKLPNAPINGDKKMIPIDLIEETRVSDIEIRPEELRPEFVKMATMVDIKTITKKGLRALLTDFMNIFFR